MVMLVMRRGEACGAEERARDEMVTEGRDLPSDDEVTSEDLLLLSTRILTGCSFNDHCRSAELASHPPAAPCRGFSVSASLAPLARCWQARLASRMWPTR